MRVLVPLACAALVVPATAHAGYVTLGSDLSRGADVTRGQGADTAYWLTNRRGRAIQVPVDGQVTQIRIRGAALSEPGAGPPANMVHFQTLGPANRNGSRRIDLTSAFADMPVDRPAVISTFAPENLCVRRDGAVAFNTIGGFGWNGGDPFDPHPIDSSHYRDGTPWRIFASVARSTTAWYSKDNGTNNGQIVTPAGGTGAAEGYGRVARGTELLMQVVVATGDDRSEACGGPRRHPDGTFVAPKVHELRVAGGGRQRPYVTRDRRFTTGVYCETPGQTCRGRAILRVGNEKVDEARVVVRSQTSARVPMRLPTALFRRLDRQGFLRVTYVLVSQFGRRSVPLSLNR